ncbi:putative lipid-transfer protein DIR1 [Diospyros lotus]|uniref:putative lipid-transfer protein DIR1 n=1 Tax=Diospyros lotus TaxID=55363 RepID=UPI0022521E5B|nr:putative lipid-transfer protein DIR1 [Diospyros lotus]
MTEGSAKLAMVAILWVLVAAATAPEPVSAMCGISTDGLVACKPSVAIGKNPAPPSAACCSALSGADMNCLCQYNKPELLASLGIDRKLVMQLPTKCNLAQRVPCA